MRDAGFLGMRASPQPQRAGDGRYHHLVAVGANSHFDLARKIDPLDGFKKTVDEMLTRLLAPTDPARAAPPPQALARKQEKAGAV
ncbi:MAG: hypothetical protein USCAAHI_01661 [Beijerinckiaceae bacterium]|nr:MAG: hypothetical protein USCAAHI_01661 [Beijerinckiaceae bacterium]